jgi:hypothetical protein
VSRKLNGTQFLVCADDTDILGENTKAIKKGGEAVLYSIRKQYMFISPHRNERPSHNMKNN